MSSRTATRAAVQMKKKGGKKERKQWSILFIITCPIITCQIQATEIMPTFSANISLYLRRVCLFVQGHLPHCNQLFARGHAEEIEAADCHLSLLSEMVTQPGDIRRAHPGQPHIPQPLLCLQKLQKEQVGTPILQGRGAHTTFALIHLADAFTRRGFKLTQDTIQVYSGGLRASRKGPTVVPRQYLDWKS